MSSTSPSPPILNPATKRRRTDNTVESNPEDHLPYKKSFNPDDNPSVVTGLNSLPTEILLQILSNLSLNDLCQVQLINRRLRDICLANPTLGKEVTILPNMKEDQLLEQMKQWTHLKILRIECRQSSYYKLVKMALQCCPKLEVLELVDCKIRIAPHMLKVIGHGKSLRALNVDGTGFLPGALESDAFNLKGLTKIIFAVNEENTMLASLSEAAMKLLGKTCTNLQEVEGFSANCDDALIAFLQSAAGQKLKRLRFNGMCITDRSLSILSSRCQQLHSLDIRDSNWRIGEIGLRAIATELPNLRTLILDTIKESVLQAALQKNYPLLPPTLTHLHFGGFSCSDDKPKQYQQSGWLVLKIVQGKDLLYEKIAMSCPALEWLQLKSCSGISDVGVRSFLLGCPRLKRLELSGNMWVTPKVFMETSNVLRELKVDDLLGGGGKDQREMLSRAMPDCSVHILKQILFKC